MNEVTYKNKEEVVLAANKALNKSLRDFISDAEITSIEEKIFNYSSSRKGYFGNLVEEFIFGLKINSRSEADFNIAGVELKTTPLKKSKIKDYVSKERLVFSMIDYDTITSEKWETSSFLEKNKLLMLMFYLHEIEKGLLDWKFKFVHLLDLISDISIEDAEQIKQDWQFIVDKVGRGEAHLLSEGDTYYLGAVTKAKNSLVVRDQPASRVPAKPRAFSLKQSYLNYLIQTKLLGKDIHADSIFKNKRAKTIEQQTSFILSAYLGKSEGEIMDMVGWNPETHPKNFRRLLVNKMFGVETNHILELDKANITLKVITLEENGTLKESISFPAFKYKELVNEAWYDEETESMSKFHSLLESQKFLFVVFQKRKNDPSYFKKFKFWNFPMKDLPAVQDVWQNTVDLIQEGKIIKEVYFTKSGKEKRKTYFPGMSYNGIAHVRPHAANANDTDELPVPDVLTGKKEFTKQCFWLNARYVQQAIENESDQD